MSQAARSFRAAASVMSRSACTRSLVAAAMSTDCEPWARRASRRSQAASYPERATASTVRASVRIAYARSTVIGAATCEPRQSRYSRTTVRAMRGAG